MDYLVLALHSHGNVGRDPCPDVVGAGEHADQPTLIASNANTCFSWSCAMTLTRVVRVLLNSTQN